MKSKKPLEILHPLALPHPKPLPHEEGGTFQAAFLPSHLVGEGPGMGGNLK
jgi:hypothetical protein